MTNQIRMQWSRLLCAERLGDDRYMPQRNRSIFVQDYDRIVFSQPFRRLANKTQVQPLYENDHVHHRLIHSIEVASVGRSLAMRVGEWLCTNGHIAEADVADLANIVQAACVAHDIGNPPFGHSGEQAMGAWFADYFAKGSPLARAVPEADQRQFIDFEGNAQGFRILTRLEMYPARAACGCQRQHWGHLRNIRSRRRIGRPC
ncbi:dGTP triphosphohydrolase [Pseudogemmobacter hezensis]|uniref:dGTP triphosphohydrolase n=1 Tax=Pseudogemmobacter hezensis TaxID=2737662 RepID=UPI0020A6D420|nr:dNTP triphosphohydrolase [Pseudogemmobacter hezensis]